MVMTIVEGLINNLPLLVNAALQLVVGLAKGIVNALPELIAKAPEIITALINGLVESIPMLVDAAIQIILAMVDFLTDPENLGMLINAAIQIVMAIASGLIQAIPQIFAAVAKLISSIWEKFKSTNWGELGANIIKGIANGIKNGVKAIADAAKNAAKTALDAAKNLLGIHSPSEVMRREVGMQIGAGMAKGVEDSRKQVQAAMSKLNDEIDTDPVAGGVGGSRGTGSVIVYVQNEMTMEGQVVTKKISRYQYKNNNTYSRSKGVVTI
ncbi:hypothetical protein SDC9_64413 [bioreactor metagenome]|uniref:Uncharacterized protein n=1 Tax=bioreactor metagenome TaxID=1076179 RepID=A0A644XP82_9ZZZZ